jgi:hypothetical protein
MPSKEELKTILQSHPVFNLREQIANTNIFGYSKYKKAQLIELMLNEKFIDRFQHITMYIRPKKKKGVRKPRPTRFITETPDLKLGQRKNKSDASIINDLFREDRKKQSEKESKAEEKAKKGAKSVRKRELVRNYEEIKEKVKEQTKDVAAKPTRKYKTREKKGEGSRGKYAKTAEEKAKKVKDKLKAVAEKLKALEEKA